MELDLINGIELLVGREENYLQVNDAPEEGLSSILTHLSENYPGFQAMFCYHNTTAPAEFLDKIGAELLDDATQMCLTQSELGYALKQDSSIIPSNDDKSFDIQLVDQTNFDAFAAFHDASNPDMYWTSRRIREKIEMWRIHIYLHENEIAGYIMLMNDFEIFCVAASENIHSKRLMAVATADAFARGGEQVLCMIAKSDEINLVAAKEIGFAECGFYQGYQMVIEK